MLNNTGTCATRTKTITRNNIRTLLFVKDLSTTKIPLCPMIEPTFGYHFAKSVAGFSVLEQSAEMPARPASMAYPNKSIQLNMIQRAFAFATCFAFALPLSVERDERCVHMRAQSWQSDARRTNFA